MYDQECDGKIDKAVLKRLLALADPLLDLAATAKGGMTGLLGASGALAAEGPRRRGKQSHLITAKVRTARVDRCGTKETMQPCPLHLHAISLVGQHSSVPRAGDYDHVHSPRPPGVGDRAVSNAKQLLREAGLFTAGWCEEHAGQTAIDLVTAANRFAAAAAATTSAGAGAGGGGAAGAAAGAGSRRFCWRSLHLSSLGLGFGLLPQLLLLLPLPRIAAAVATAAAARQLLRGQVLTSHGGLAETFAGRKQHDGRDSGAVLGGAADKPGPQGRLPRWALLMASAAEGSGLHAFAPKRMWNKCSDFSCPYSSCVPTHLPIGSECGK